MYSRLTTRKFRSLILELLERRELFAFDLTDVSNHLTMGVHEKKRTGAAIDEIERKRKDRRSD